MSDRKPTLDYARPIWAVPPPPRQQRTSLLHSLCATGILLAASAVVTPAVWYTFRAVGWLLTRL